MKTRLLDMARRYGFAALSALALAVPSQVLAQLEDLYTENFDLGAGPALNYVGGSTEGAVAGDYYYSTSTGFGDPATGSINYDFIMDTANPDLQWWYAGLGVNVGSPVPFLSFNLSTTYLSVDVFTGTSTAAPSVRLVIKSANGGSLTYTQVVTENTWTRLSQIPLSSFSNTNFDFNAATFEIIVEPIWPIQESSSLRIDNIVLNRDPIPPGAPVFLSASRALGNVGTSLTYTITATQAPTSYGATGLPAGLSINTTTGVISGTPTQSGEFIANLTATNALGTTGLALYFDISTAGQVYYADSLVTNAYFWGKAEWHTANYTLNFTNGHLSFNSAELPYVGSYGPSNSFPWEGGYTFLPNASILLDPTKVLRVSLEARAAAPNGVNGIVVELIDNVGATTDIYQAFLPPVTDTWTRYTVAVLSTTGNPNPAAIESIALTSGGANLGIVDIRNVKIEALEPATAKPIITSPFTASAELDTPFTYTVTATGSPTSVSASGLPDGLSFNPATGVISGTPTAAGVTTIPLGATNANGSGASTLTLTVTGATLSPIQDWALLNFGDSDLTGLRAPDADFDGDGLSNLLEYAIASNPTVATPASAIATALVDSKLQLTFLRARAELTYVVEGSSDLANPASWQVIATNPGAVSDTTPVTVEDTDSVPAAPKRFLRLRVTL